MNRDDVVSRLRAAEPALRQEGVLHAALFGSMARGDKQDTSDIDIWVELAPEADLDLIGYIGIVEMIKDLFQVPVDVANRAGLKPYIRPSAERDAIYAF